MKIIIPYKQDVHHGIELKYALRGIETHLTGWENVYLIGDRPEWYVGSHAYYSDIAGRKEYNIYKKLLVASKLFHVNDSFVLWNDDHFLLKKLDVKGIRYWYNQSLEEEAKRPASSRYRIHLQNTMNLLNGGNNYDIHVPIIFNKGKFHELFSNRTDELCVKSFYTNQVEHQPEQMDDLKINGWFTYDEILAKIQGRLFFSTGTALCAPMLDVLEKLYPYKSKFER